MKNATIVFAFFGVMITAALIFAFIYLPKMADAKGIGSKNMVLELPLDVTDIKYDTVGITPFCLNKNNGIDFEVREKTLVLAPVSGVVTHIYAESHRIAIQPSSSVEVSVSPVTALNVQEGNYVNAGDTLGYTLGTNLHFIVDNQKNDRYECPYLYLNEVGQKIVSNGLERSENSTGRICECSSLDY